MLSALQMPSARKLLRARRNCDPCSKHKESAQLRASAPPCEDARDGARKNQCTVPTSPPCDDARTMPMSSHACETPRTTKLGHHHRDLKGAHRPTTTMLCQGGENTNVSALRRCSGIGSPVSTYRYQGLAGTILKDCLGFRHCCVLTCLCN